MIKEKKEKTLRAGTYEEKNEVRLRAMAALETMKSVEKRMERKAKSGEYTRTKGTEFNGYRVAFRPV